MILTLDIEIVDSIPTRSFCEMNTRLFVLHLGVICRCCVCVWKFVDVFVSGLVTESGGGLVMECLKILLNIVINYYMCNTNVLMARYTMLGNH